MKIKYFSIILFCACFLTVLVVFPSGSTQGIKYGLTLCYNVIIPSLFPFTVCSLFLFESNAINRLQKLTVKHTTKKNDTAVKIIIIYILSCIAGYPVGANLIETSYKKEELSRKQCIALLGFCVNPGPAFIVIAVGSGILGSAMLGYFLLIANITASLIISLFSIKFLKSEKVSSNNPSDAIQLSEAFVNATYRGCNSIINICSFMLVFSSIIGLINEILPKSSIKQTLLAVMEVTNGILLCDKNIYLISFVLGFGGICVHFQVLSMCKSLKPAYLPFLLQRIALGALSSFIIFILTKTFNICLPTISVNSGLTFSSGENAVPFSIALLILTVCFMLSMQKKIRL